MDKLHILILNGPNLNLIGRREPEIYGSQTFDSFYEDLKSEFENIRLAYFQSNHEGDIIDSLHANGFELDGIIINAGGYTHTSIAIADAIRAITCPVIEVHISDIYARESFRHHSYLSEACVKQINGHGLKGYKLAIEHLVQLCSTQS